MCYAFYLMIVSSKHDQFLKNLGISPEHSGNLSTNLWHALYPNERHCCCCHCWPVNPVCVRLLVVALVQFAPPYTLVEIRLKVSQFIVLAINPPRWRFIIACVLCPGIRSYWGWDLVLRVLPGCVWFGAFAAAWWWWLLLSLFSFSSLWLLYISCCQNGLCGRQVNYLVVDMWDWRGRVICL